MPNRRRGNDRHPPEQAPTPVVPQGTVVGPLPRQIQEPLEAASIIEKKIPFALLGVVIVAAVAWTTQQMTIASLKESVGKLEESNEKMVIAVERLQQWQESLRNQLAGKPAANGPPAPQPNAPTDTPVQADAGAAPKRQTTTRRPGTAPIAVDTQPQGQAPPTSSDAGDAAVDPEIDPSLAATGEGELLISTTPWSHVLLDGQDTGRDTPVRALRVPAGEHTVGLRTPDDELHEVRVDVKPGRVVRVIRRF